jgi:hypothetical protein
MKIYTTSIPVKQPVGICISGFLRLCSLVNTSIKSSSRGCMFCFFFSSHVILLVTNIHTKWLLILQKCYVTLVIRLKILEWFGILNLYYLNWRTCWLDKNLLTTKRIYEPFFKIWQYKSIIAAHQCWPTFFAFAKDTPQWQLHYIYCISSTKKKHEVYGIHGHGFRWFNTLVDILLTEQQQYNVCR